MTAFDGSNLVPTLGRLLVQELGRAAGELREALKDAHRELACDAQRELEERAEAASTAGAPAEGPRGPSSAAGGGLGPGERSAG